MGYDLFICLHGNNHGVATSINDGLWKYMIPFEWGGFQNGTITLASRKINNKWNLHFVDEYPAYIIFRSVESNRIYFMDFSSGRWCHISSIREKDFLIYDMLYILTVFQLLIYVIYIIYC